MPTDEPNSRTMLINFINKLQLIRQDITANRPTETLLMAKELLALVRRRIQNTGRDYNEQPLGSYSDNDLPAFFYYNKSLNASGEQAVKKAQKAGTGLSYKEFRRANNRQTEFVDLNFSGTMWREYDAEIIAANDLSATARINPRTPRSQNVAGYNAKRYGEFIRPTDNERKMLIQANRERVLKSLKKILVKR